MILRFETQIKQTPNISTYLNQSNTYQTGTNTQNTFKLNMLQIIANHGGNIKKQASVNVTADKVINFYEILNSSSPENNLIDYSSSDDSYIKDFGPAPSFVLDKNKVITFVSALKHNYIFDIYSLKD